MIILYKKINPVKNNSILTKNKIFPVKKIIYYNI